MGESAELGADESRLVRLAEAGLRVAVAESLTGGMLADAFVSIPGASSVFAGGIVCYDTFLKRSILHVDEALLAERGPVDSEVARQMANHVRNVCAVPREVGRDAESASIGLSTTGVAGPDPDPQTGQPAGTVWLGVSSLLGDRTVLLKLQGSRAEIRRETVARAIAELETEVDALLS